MSSSPPDVQPRSVHEFPRPPHVEEAGRHASVEFNDTIVANSDEALAVLETGHPPTIYFPERDVKQQLLTPSRRLTICEWKGRASYYHLSVGDRQADNAIWCYPEPTPPFSALRRHLAFYPALMDRCVLGDEVVEAEASAYHGGWITSELQGL